MVKAATRFSPLTRTCLSLSLSAHDTQRFSPGGCRSLNGEALDGQRAAPERSAGARGSRAQRPVPALGLQHSQGHRAAHETG